MLFAQFPNQSIITIIYKIEGTEKSLQQKQSRYHLFFLMECLLCITEYDFVRNMKRKWLYMREKDHFTRQSGELKQLIPIEKEKKKIPEPTNYISILIIYFIR